MYRFRKIMLPLLGVGSMFYGTQALAGNPPPDGYRDPQEIPLSQQDLRDITANIMARQPLLASSPGIKFARAHRYQGEDTATVIYFPHLETAAIKQAFQVDCRRPAPDGSWSCTDAEIRRYLSLASQDYEARVTGPIESDAAIALIEASKALLPAKTPTQQDVPNSVMIVSSHEDGARVSWVNFAGKARMMIVGELAEGGDPKRAEDWVVHRFR